MKVVRLVLITALTVVLAQAPLGVYGQAASEDDSAQLQTAPVQPTPDSPKREPCGAGCHGLCMVHGYGSCPQSGPGFLPAMRQALAPSDHPYFGLQPIVAPRGCNGYVYGCEPGYPAPYPAHFPRLRALLTAQPRGMQSTRPVEPMRTYTTRGPRDFLHPNPPSIGY